MRRELYPNKKQVAQKTVDTNKLEKHVQHVKSSEGQGLRDNALNVFVVLVCALGLYFLYNSSFAAAKNQNAVVKSVEPNASSSKTIQTSVKAPTK